jgi:hypothetical protein
LTNPAISPLGISINTEYLGEDEGRTLLDKTAKADGLPTTDPIPLRHWHARRPPRTAISSVQVWAACVTSTSQYWLYRSPMARMTAIRSHSRKDEHENQFRGFPHM